MRLRSKRIGHSYIYEISFVPRSREYGFSVKVWKVSISRKVHTFVYNFNRSVFAHIKLITYSVFHCLVLARIVFLERRLLIITKQWNANVEVFRACANVSVLNLSNTFPVFTRSMNLEYLTPAEVRARFAFWAITIDGIWQHFLLESF